MEKTIAKKGLLGVSKSLWRDPRTWLFLLVITEKSLFRYVLMILDRLTGTEAIREVALHTVYIVVIALCLKKGSKVHGGDIFIMLFVVLAIIITWLIYPNNIEMYMFGKDQFWPTVFPSFRFFIAGLFLIPNKENLELMGKVSCLAILVETAFVLFVLRGSDLQNSDDMSRAYFMLLNVLLVINFAFDKKTLISLAISLVGIMLLLSMGTRGPIVIVLAFMATKLLFQMTTNTRKRVAFVFILLLLIWFINSPYWNLTLLSIRDVLSSLGMSTRVIDFTIQGETLTYYSERDDIAQIVINKIKERPEGWGVYGEWQFLGWSAHNMYLEILDHYGIFGGGIILLWIFFIVIKAFNVTKETSVRSLVLLFACNVLVRGVFGGGFLTSATFLMIGYCLQVCRKTNFKYLTA